MASRRHCSIGLVVALLSSIPLQAATIEGRSAAGDVEFSALAATTEHVVVSFVVQDSIEIRADIDYAREEVRVRASLMSSTHPKSLGPAERAALARLAASPPWERGGRLAEALASTLNFLASLPLGATVDFASAQGKGVGEKRSTSLCPMTGSTLSGTYTADGKTHTGSGQIGPCYSKPNECLGRCGEGCGGPPGISVQRFTQQCFNHDLCTRSTGRVLGECRDEFIAAMDDFFFAPDCGSLQGTWMDGYNFEWKFSPSYGPLFVGGYVQTTTCLRWRVTGTHNGAELRLTATNPQISENCCASFTYTGTATDCNTASGTWENGGCSGTGTWTMVRNARGVQLTVTDDGGNPVNPAVRP